MALRLGRTCKSRTRVVGAWSARRGVGVLLVASALLAPCVAGAATTEAVATHVVAKSTAGCTPPKSWRDSRLGALAARMARDVVTGVNTIRARRGLRRLASSPALTRSAHWKSLQMAHNRYLAHSDLGRRDFVTRIHDCGYPAGTNVGENIGYGYTPKGVLAAWMSSPEHRQNILDPRWVATGVAVALTPGTGVPYFTQEFGQSVAG
jgi:uncharacterized protein YkwD